MLDQTDRVFFVEDGEVVADGTHRELLSTHEGYRWTVTRGEDL
jgi:ABC-type multidrug transport system fused ATPase/permease subunit